MRGYGSRAKQEDNERAREGIFIEAALQHIGVGGVDKRIRPTQTREASEGQIYATQQEEIDRSRAMVYLNDVAKRLGGDERLWRCEVIVAESVADGIRDFAIRHEVDLIAMATHDRKGLGGLLRRNVASHVQREGPIAVKVFKHAELAEAAVTLMTERTVIPGEEDALRKLLRELRSKAAQRRGYVAGETKIDALSPIHFITLSNWASMAAWESWENDPERDEIIGRINALLQVEPTTGLWLHDEAVPPVALRVGAGDHIQSPAPAE